MSNHHPQPMASTRNELRNLRLSSQATVAELKAFLREMKGRSPQDMLGMVAGNQLVRATVQSCVIVLAILIVFTVVPYVSREGPKPAPHVPKNSEVTPDKPKEPDVPKDPDIPKPEAAEVLGVGEEKKAPRDVNPLESQPDSFLDELD